MGEIGIQRHDFLYEIDFWEVRRIIRGYRRRDKLKNQLIAECVYAAMYAMRDPKGKGVEDMFPMLFDDDDDDEPPISEEDVADMQAMMDAFNNNLNEQNNKQL